MTKITFMANQLGEVHTIVPEDRVMETLKALSILNLPVTMVTTEGETNG